MWNVIRRKPDPVLPRHSIKPADKIIFSIATGEESVMLFPYQYVNWALEQLGEQPTVRAGDNITFGLCSKVHEACKKYIREVDYGL